MVVIIVTIDDNYWMIPSSQAAFPLRGHPPGLRSQLAADGDESGHGGDTAFFGKIHGKSREKWSFSLENHL